MRFLNSDQKALFGVFDGHGGREVAVWCQQNYEQILSRDFNGGHSENERKEWLRKSFLKVDEDLKKPEHLKKLQELRKEKPPNKPPLLQILEQSKPKDAENNEEDSVMDTVGCTANVIFIDKEVNKIYVVNAGDSRCTMGKAGKTVEMSIDHKPESQIEIDRIEKAGSVITEGRVDGNLNLTRSLGDLKYKQRDNLTPEEQAITSNPDVYEFEYSDDIDFIIMGCDGIWEKKSNEEMVEYIYDKLKQNKELKQIVSELLLDTIAPSVAETQGIGCDNMTCILIKFNK